MFENASFMWHNAFYSCVWAVSQKAATVAIKDAPLVAHVAIVAAGRNSSCKQQQEPRMEPPLPVCAVIKFFAFII